MKIVRLNVWIVITACDKWEANRMAKKLRVTMPDGSKWDVPVEIIAKNKAEYYYSQDEKEFEEEYKFTLSDHAELIDWAENNMNWKDVRQFAKRVKAPSEPDYQEGWVNGDKEVVEDAECK